MEVTRLCGSSGRMSGRMFMAELQRNRSPERTRRVRNAGLRILDNILSSFYVSQSPLRAQILSVRFLGFACTTNRYGLQSMRRKQGFEMAQDRVPRSLIIKDQKDATECAAIGSPQIDFVVEEEAYQETGLQTFVENLCISFLKIHNNILLRRVACCEGRVSDWCGFWEGPSPEDGWGFVTAVIS